MVVDLEISDVRRKLPLGLAWLLREIDAARRASR
jgi:hypothetical protein